MYGSFKAQNEIMKILVPMIIELRETKKKICEACPYREATHQMGCIECCPLVSAEDEAGKK